MNNRDFTKLAMMGLVGGCLLGSSPAAAEQGTNNTTNKGVLLAHSCGKSGCAQKNQGSRSYVADNSDSTRGNTNSDPSEMDNETARNNNYNDQPTASGCGTKTRPNNNNGRSQVADNGCKRPSNPSNSYNNNTRYVSEDDEMTRPSNGCSDKNRYVSDNDDGQITRPSNGCKGTVRNDQYQPSRDNMSNKRDAINQSNQTGWNQRN